VYENRQERERDEETVAETFGPNEQPTLEKIEYQVRMMSTILPFVSNLHVRQTDVHRYSVYVEDFLQMQCWTLLW